MTGNHVDHSGDSSTSPSQALHTSRAIILSHHLGMSTTIHSLPLEIITHILSYSLYPGVTRYHLSLTCRAFYNFLGPTQPTKDDILSMRYIQFSTYPDKGIYHDVCTDCARILPFYAFFTKWDMTYRCVFCLSRVTPDRLGRIDNSYDWLSNTTIWCDECNQWELYRYNDDEPSIMPHCYLAESGQPGRGFSIPHFVERMRKFERILPPVDGEYGARTGGVWHMRECVLNKNRWRGAPSVRRNELAKLEIIMEQLEDAPKQTRKILLRKAREMVQGKSRRSSTTTTATAGPRLTRIEIKAVRSQIMELEKDLKELAKEVWKRRLVGKIQNKGRILKSRILNLRSATGKS